MQGFEILRGEVQSCKDPTLPNPKCVSNNSGSLSCLTETSKIQSFKNTLALKSKTSDFYISRLLVST